MDMFERIDAWNAKMDALREKISAMEHREFMTSGSEINAEIERLKIEMQIILDDIR